MIKAKKLLCTGCAKSAVRGGKLNLKKIIGASEKKYLVRWQIFRYGLPEDFSVNGKKANGDRHTDTHADRLPERFFVLHIAAKKPWNFVCQALLFYSFYTCGSWSGCGIHGPKLMRIRSGFSSLAIISFVLNEVWLKSNASEVIKNRYNWFS